MASTRQITNNRALATRPLYAAVGAGDLAVAFARTAATDVQTRVSKVDLQPKALRDQGRAAVTARVDDLNKVTQARVADLQKEAQALPAKLEALVNTTIADLNKQYIELALRGQGLVSRIRGQQATQEVKAQAKSTATRAKTTGTQAKKSASTAKKSAKATGTSAKKTASAAKKATTDAADKTGN